MNKVLTFILILTLKNIGYCQSKQIIGEVKSFENDEPLPYVNIGIANKTVGTVSNENGIFKLDLNEKATSKDTVIFSFIGFKTKKYLASELINKKKTVLLQPQNTELDEVVVTTKKIKLKPKRIGRTSKGLGLTHSNFYSYYEKDVDDRLSKERGMKFKIRKNCHIQNLNFNITSNDFKSLKFRVNIYKIENGLPTDLIVQKNIVFEINDNFLGWFKVDLEPYDIYLKEELEEIAVTIQWLESVKTDKKSKYFAISTASSPTHTAYFREKAMDGWTKGGQNLSFYLNAIVSFP
ncbi:carboxypeptidase-like regulatory domain-containing protein [Maribacter polysaccharolyticus]|uniref:carboxypeptidase-like regulatory domain-containing protein n=1 Tax=Maribacter polysaccharolyticus TaxID=3020831 RepID=UPI00237F1E20|nr:carboxypeptidase-like regulatory domain-containing protein [Maribacter polysaccharolyticus]MDE3744128.1 carboxypeptidase-like regulatory domain-containing protein [Maribacter polysaccharolyticus]